MRCGDCKYLGKEILIDDWENYMYQIPTGYYKCDFAKMNSNDIGYIPEEKPICFVEDVSGYYAALKVREDFGCVAFEQKDDA